MLWVFCNGTEGGKVGRGVGRQWVWGGIELGSLRIFISGKGFYKEYEYFYPETYMKWVLLLYNINNKK